MARSTWVNSTQGLSGLPAAALEGEQALLDGGEIGKVVGREHLALADRHVDLHLVQPRRVKGVRIRCVRGQSLARRLIAATRSELRLSTTRNTVWPRHTARFPSPGPLGDGLATGVQVGRDLVVVEPFGCHEHDLGPHDIRIRQRVPNGSGPPGSCAPGCSTRGCMGSSWAGAFSFQRPSR
jgi:hypothetical protein